MKPIVFEENMRKADFIDIILIQDHNETLQTYCRERLQPLLDTGREEHLHTLKTYFDHDRSIQRTSEILYVHKNTVIQRVKKSLEILNIDIHDHAAMTELAMMLNVLDRL